MCAAGARRRQAGAATQCPGQRAGILTPLRRFSIRTLAATKLTPGIQRGGPGARVGWVLPGGVLVLVVAMIWMLPQAAVPY